jgi:isopenicillin N synthase-like dioxygenase
MTRQAIPLIDLQQFAAGTPESKQQFAQQLGKAFEETGFVSLINHGVAENLIDDYYLAVQKFFSLPVEIKHKYEIPELAGQRGYTSFGKEHAKGSTSPDLKEFWQIGQSPPQGEILPAGQYPANVQVLDVPVFFELGNQLYKSFENTGRYLLQAIGIYLGIGEFYFDKHIHNGNSILRAIHYPPITCEPSNAMRAEQHEDINLITLLVGASAEGLQLLTRQNIWLDITAPEGCIVVNVGDMLQRLTNNRLRSTTHRVVNPSPEKWGTSRYSIPFFMHPRSEMRLDCLPTCVNHQHPLAYAPISAGEYLDERLIEIGLKSPSTS